MYYSPLGKPQVWSGLTIWGLLLIMFVVYLGPLWGVVVGFGGPALLVGWIYLDLLECIRILEKRLWDQQALQRQTDKRLAEARERLEESQR